ncbi:MAG: 4,5-DOPA dioxygenase extradiol [Alphaproteobacteria bacterium]|nr:4,5-DOPA dioxygenase extradiol [Alphaproteobacteria bacterium]
MTTRAPALFLGHGSPMNAIEDTHSARGWSEIARAFPKPNAIVCISAHWVTEGVKVTSNAHPRTIHDFGRGFPQALFDVQYPAPGDPDLARAIVEKLTAYGAQLDDTWGLDHGAWSVVKHMYPDADVPIIQVSLDIRRPSSEHHAIAQKLAELRDDNILILGSGNIVHNLPAFFRAPSPDPQPWVATYDALIVDGVANDQSKVVNYTAQPEADVAAPDWEHFTPIIYALGARRDGEQPYVFNRHYFPGISMTSIAFGLPQ